MFTVSSCFISNFKIGDNINYNLDTVRLLYKLSAEQRSRKALLFKPITVALVSIAEAMLYDFIDRVQSSEHVSTLPKQTVAAIGAKNYDSLTNLIDCSRKFDLFDAGGEFYDQLEELRKLRNRVHIQNRKKHFESDEAKAFNVDRQEAAERVLEYIAKFLSLTHPRKSTTHGFVSDFDFPWSEHWDFTAD